MGLNNECSMSKNGILLNLQKGLETEKKSLELCNELVDLLDNEDEKKSILKIAKDERRHIKIIENLMKIVKNTFLEQNRKFNVFV